MDTSSEAQPRAPEGPRYLSREAAARKAKVNIRTLDRWRRQGKLTSFRSGSRIMVREDQLIDLIRPVLKEIAS